jgi:hypothetical protein
MAADPKPTGAATATKAPEAAAKRFDPSVGKLSGCPVCGIVPPLDVTFTVQTQSGKMFRNWRFDPSRPAAYQALAVHYHGLPAVAPGPEYPKGLPAIPGQHPNDVLPADPDAHSDAED